MKLALRGRTIQTITRTLMVPSRLKACLLIGFFCLFVCLFACLFACLLIFLFFLGGGGVLSFRPIREFFTHGRLRLLILTYTRYSWQLISEGSLAVTPTVTRIIRL